MADVTLIGDGIQQRLDELGRKPVWLAGNLGVSEKTVDRWRLGRSAPHAEILVPIADTLGVTLDWLLRGHEAER